MDQRPNNYNQGPGGPGQNGNGDQCPQTRRINHIAFGAADSVY